MGLASINGGSSVLCSSWLLLYRLDCLLTFDALAAPLAPLGLEAGINSESRGMLLSLG